jgi:hypothetical protein
MHNWLDAATQLRKTLMNFTESLDRKMEEVKRPPVLPLGHYIAAVKAHPDLEDFESSKTGVTYDRVTFQLSVVAAHDDVDPDELAEYGNVAGVPLRKTFLFSRSEDDKANYERSRFQLRQFLEEHLGMDAGMAFNEAFAACVNAQCLVELKHRPDPENPEVIYAEAGRTTAI